jgi:SAM-dependent methyltransferase
LTTDRHWFEPIADHLGRAYLRYSFAQGTAQEVEFLVRTLELEPGSRVLDVGCGPGRHAHALARKGIDVVGVDISERFVAIATEDAPAGATFRRLDARHLDYDVEFDAVICLCQGGFGLVGPGDDTRVLRGIARALAPGGRLALSAFSAYFVVRYPVDGGSFDPLTGVHHETTVIKDEAGADADTELWTTCYTPRELRLLVEGVGLDVDDIWSVEPGRYQRTPANTETPELLVVARRPR